MSRTSASLLERLRVGSDDRAWEQFVELYAPLIYHWLRECGLQHQDVCDVGQEVVLTVGRSADGFPTGNELLTTPRNDCLLD